MYSKSTHSLKQWISMIKHGHSWMGARPFHARLCVSNVDNFPRVIALVHSIPQKNLSDETINGGPICTYNMHAKRSQTHI